MNDLPVMGSVVMSNEFWDRQGANIASRKKKMYSDSILKCMMRMYSDSILSEGDLGNVDAWKVQVFVPITEKY